MSVSRRPPLTETAVGTTWRTLKSFLFILIIVAVVFMLFSAAVAISTADKCDGKLHADKEWTVFPPGWECASKLPGQG
jgi:hypothetical protein